MIAAMVLMGCGEKSPIVEIGALTGMIEKCSASSARGQGGASLKFFRKSHLEDFCPSKC